MCAHIYVTEREVMGDGENEIPACLWRDCTQCCEDTASMVRHVYYHAFHSKLKSVGQNLQQNSNLQVSFPCYYAAIPFGNDSHAVEIQLPLYEYKCMPCKSNILFACYC